ncbi:MAG: amidohydrolase family protein [Methyloligellaceae bacterium]
MAQITLTNCMIIDEAGCAPASGRFDIEITDDRISDVRLAGTQPPKGRAIDSSNRLATAGLINGHHHSHEHFHKGRYDKLPLELWMNYVRPMKPLPWTPRQVYLRTMIGAIEALRTGTTTLIDDLNISPVLDDDLVDAVFRAYEDIGIRALVGISLFDRPFYRAVPYVDEEFPPDLLRSLDAAKATPADEVLAFVGELAHDRHPSENRVGCLVAPSAPQRCTDDFLIATRALADEFGLPIIIHVHETRLQAVTAQEFYGCTMIEHLDRLGFLKPHTSLIHAVWLTPKDIETLAGSGVTIQHNPTSNLKLGSGIAPIRPLLDAGVNVSLGTDGCGSTETLSMLRAVNNAALLDKLRDDAYEAWIGAREAWHAGTRGGAAAINRGHELGAIKKGYLADIALYRLDRIPFAPLNNALNQLVYSETGASLDSVFVAGEQVMDEGRLSTVNEAEILREICDVHEELETLIASSEMQTDKIREAYDRIYRRCNACPIPSDTLPAKLHRL